MNPVPVDIIIPTLNRAAMLETALRSALAQDYAHLRVIVSDNASSDATGEVCGRFAADPRLTYVRQAGTLPMYKHWSTVLENHARAEWTLILSDDDFLLDPGYISKAAALIAREPGLAMVHAGHETFFEATGERKPEMRKLPEVSGGDWYFINYWAQAGSFRLMTVLFRRGAARGFTMFAEDGILGCDTMDFLRLALNGKVGFISTIAAGYRMHPGRESAGKPWRVYFENLRHITIPYDYASLKGIFSQPELEAWRWRIFAGYFFGILSAIAQKGDIRGYFSLMNATLERYRWFSRYLGKPRFIWRSGVLFLQCALAFVRGRALTSPPPPAG
ncbi:MAG: hypothetical protein A2285_01840 [Elusimicrobia bacterium RIFOXYA12_FULL_57_11]|nr:MAG: hypothetical protein A2285_01840 [Elusimicrobia bacterium RIFOXYA12_FULL_57_11]